MFNRLLLIIFFAANIHLLQAQKVIIKLEKEALDLNFSNYYVDSVIDARNQGECIGYILKGTEIRQTAAYFEKPFCREIQDLFTRSISIDKEKVPIILRINKFLLSNYYLSEIYYSMVEVNISFIIYEDGKYFELYQGMATSESSGIYAGGAAGPLIACALGNCFLKFLNQEKKGLLSPKEIPENSLSENPLYGRKYMIEQVSIPKKGIYRTFSDFINYRVDTLRAIKVEYIPESKKEPESANIVLAQDNTWVGNIWGFSDGTTNYININDKYYPMYRQDSAFRFHALNEGTTFKDLSPYIAGSLAVGLVGAMFGVAIVPIIPNPVKDFIVECQLELNSGMIFPADLVAYKEMNSRMILYMSKYQKEENEMEIYLDGELLCKLNRNSFYLLTIPPGKQQVELCLKSKDQELCESYTPVQYDAGVFICEVKNNQPPSRSEAKAEVRNSLLDKIITGEIERKCPDK
jgi:hypothetical protein